MDVEPSLVAKANHVYPIPQTIRIVAPNGSVGPHEIEIYVRQGRSTTENENRLSLIELGRLPHYWGSRHAGLFLHRVFSQHRVVLGLEKIGVGTADQAGVDGLTGVLPDHPISAAAPMLFINREGRDLFFIGHHRRWLRYGRSNGADIDRSVLLRQKNEAVRKLPVEGERAVENVTRGGSLSATMAVMS